jgi:hypothetical protein
MHLFFSIQGIYGLQRGDECTVFWLGKPLFDGTVERLGGLRPRRYDRSGRWSI